MLIKSSLKITFSSLFFFLQSRIGTDDAGCTNTQSRRVTISLWGMWTERGVKGRLCVQYVCMRALEWRGENKQVPKQQWCKMSITKQKCQKKESTTLTWHDGVPRGSAVVDFLRPLLASLEQAAVNGSAKPEQPITQVIQKLWITATTWGPWAYGHKYAPKCWCIAE